MNQVMLSAWTVKFGSCVDIFGDEFPSFLPQCPFPCVYFFFSSVCITRYYYHDKVDDHDKADDHDNSLLLVYCLVVFWRLQPSGMMLAVPKDCSCCINIYWLTQLYIYKSIKG